MSYDYAQLQADITTMMVDDTVNAALCIRLGEKELNRICRFRSMISSVILIPILAGDRYVAGLPSNFLELFHAEQNGIRLELRSQNNWDSKDFNIYTIMGTQIHVTAISGIYLWYYSRATELSDSNTTNVFTQQAYDALLYLALGHASIQQNRQDMAQTYMASGIELATSAQNTDEESRFRGAPLVQGAGA